MYKVLTKAHFECNEVWYVEKVGLAFEEALAVILAYIWLDPTNCNKEGYTWFAYTQKDLEGRNPVPVGRIMKFDFDLLGC